MGKLLFDDTLDLKHGSIEHIVVTRFVSFSKVKVLEKSMF